MSPGAGRTGAPSTGDGRRRWGRWVIGLAVGLVGAAMAALVAVWWTARPSAPDAFYAAPTSATASPGQLLPSEPYVRGLPPDARAWRILYTTTRADATPAVASATILVGNQDVARPRPVIAWAHGTTGVEPGCAPSVLGEPFHLLPALDEVMAAGWVVVATDYGGLGTAGPHPYLIGEGEARSVLDAVRAARQLDGLALDRRTIVWGHSQGGHAALWTGILASEYAPEVGLVGVAALAPASDLAALMAAVQATPIGRIIAAYLVQSLSQVYADVPFDAVVRPEARWWTRDLASRCLAGRGGLLSALVASLLMQGPVLAVDPKGDNPLAWRLAENTPRRPIAAPLFIAQGLSDELVLPSIQSGFVADRCAQGQRLIYRTYTGRDHLSVVAPDSPLGADLIRWTSDRLASAPQAAGCQRVPS